MKIPSIRVELYKFLDRNKWSTTPIVLDFPTEFDEDEGIETRKDTFQFRIRNSRQVKTNDFDNKLGLKDQNANSFRIEDKILVYAWYGTQPSDLNSSLIIDGIVNELDYSNSEDSNLVSIKGANSTEEMLSTMIPTSILKEREHMNASEAIIAIGSRVNSFNRGKKMALWLTTEKKRWDPIFQDFVIDNTNGINGSIQAVKSDGTAFPDITYAENWKSAYQQIETLSTREYTDDDAGGVYVFGFKPFSDPISGEFFNQFFWNNKTTTLQGSIEEGVDVYPITIRRGTWDVYNAAIVNAGEDLYGAGILRLAYNATSMGKIGAKWKYLPLTNKFDRSYDAQKSKGLEVGSTFGTDRFPDAFDDGGSVWNMGFETYDDLGLLTGIEATATSDTEFNNVLRDHAGWEAQNEGQQIVERFGEARYKSEGELELGSNNYILGDLYEIKSPSYGWDGDATNPTKKLRLVDARHIFNQSGWTTTLYYEEDEKLISDRVN